MVSEEIDGCMGKSCAGKRNEHRTAHQQCSEKEDAPNCKTVVNGKEPLPIVGKVECSEHLVLRQANNPSRIKHHYEHRKVRREATGKGGN